MPKFNLSSMVTVSAYTVVEADTLEDAIEISKKREVVNQSVGGCSENDMWIVDEIDGEPHPNSIHQE